MLIKSFTTSFTKFSGAYSRGYGLSCISAKKNKPNFQILSGFVFMPWSSFSVVCLAPTVWLHLFLSAIFFLWQPETAFSPNESSKILNSKQYKLLKKAAETSPKSSAERCKKTTHQVPAITLHSEAEKNLGLKKQNGSWRNVRLGQPGLWCNGLVGPILALPKDCRISLWNLLFGNLGGGGSWIYCLTGSTMVGVTQCGIHGVTQWLPLTSYSQKNLWSPGTLDVLKWNSGLSAL